MRIKVLALVLALVFVASGISGCSLNPEKMINELINSATQSASNDIVVGETGKTYAAEWFDFTVHSIRAVDSYAGYVPASGYKLYDVLVTEKNTYDEVIPMGTFDFYMDDPDFEEYIWPIDPLDDTMMPEDFDLRPGETVQYHMIFEIPADVTDLMLLYTEFFEDDEEGRTFVIYAK